MTPKNDREMEWNMAFGSLIWCLGMLMLLVTMVTSIPWKGHLDLYSSNKLAIGAFSTFARVERHSRAS